MSNYIQPPQEAIALSSGEMSIPSGVFTIELNIINKVGLGVNESDFVMDVINIGSFEVDFDFIEDIGDINEFKINVPVFEFEVNDVVKETFLGRYSNTKLLSSFISPLSEYDLIVVKATFNGSSDYYFSTKSQTEFSYKNRSVKINAKHPLLYSVPPYGVTWGDQMNGLDVNTRALYQSSSSVLGNNYLVRDIIEKYIFSLGDSSNLFRYSSYLYNLKKSTYTGLTAGLHDFFVKKTESNVDTDFGTATDVVKEAALRECAIVGNMLGYAFYTPRGKKDYVSVISASQLIDFELDYNYKSIRYSNVFIEAGDTDYLRYTQYMDMNSKQIYENNSIQPISVVDKLGRHDIDVFFNTSVEETILGFTDVESGVYLLEYTADGGMTPITLPSSKINPYQASQISIILDYFKMFRVGSGLKISGKITGIESLLPFEYIRMNNGVHPLVENKDFRPSYLKYNIKDDIVEFEAYEF